jgi:hypothetical protein
VRHASIVARDAPDSACVQVTERGLRAMPNARAPGCRSTREQRLEPCLAKRGRSAAPCCTAGFR